MVKGKNFGNFSSRVEWVKGLEKVVMVFVGAVALLFVHTPVGFKREGRYPLQSGLGMKYRYIAGRCWGDES